MVMPTYLGLTMRVTQAMLFTRTDPKLPYPDLQVHVVSAAGGMKKGEEHVSYKNTGIDPPVVREDEPDYVVMLLPSLLHPKSRGLAILRCSTVVLLSLPFAHFLLRKRHVALS